MNNRDTKQQGVKNAEYHIKNGMRLKNGSDLNDLESARSEFQKAIELEPDNYYAHAGLGEVLCKLQDINNSIITFKKAIQIFPDHYWAHAGLGAAYNRNREFDKAIPELSIASRLNPKSNFVENNLNYAKHQVSKLKQKDNEARERDQKYESFVEFYNTDTGKREHHRLRAIQDFLNSVIHKNDDGTDRVEPLPISKMISEIGESPVFIKAETGVGKTITVPIQVFIKLADSFYKDKQFSRSADCPQVYVVEPRIPICINQMEYMNNRYQRFIQQSDNLANSHEKNLFGCITSVTGRRNPYVPIVFITTGIFESMAQKLSRDSQTEAKESLDPKRHRVIIDEAHITIEQNPGVEISIAICRQNNLKIDYMSATIDNGTIEQDLGVEILEAKGRNYPIIYHNCGRKLDEILVDIVERYLIKQQDLPEIMMEYNRKPGQWPRPQGMLVVVNSHQSEMSDTKKYERMILNADFNKPKQVVDTLVLASPIIRNHTQKLNFDNRITAIERRNGKYVIISTNVVEMGVTYNSIDFVVTMDSEYHNVYTDGHLMLELRELGVNALFQRAGRVGRKRPGMCMITKDFREGKGAWL